METVKRASPWRTGQNCWRVEQAGRAAFLIDGEAYFRAFRSSVIQARESIYILAWDIHSQLRLVREEPSDGWPVTLGELLSEAVARRRGLRIHVLAWDFAMIYAMEREWLPTLRFRWNSHRRVYIHLDAEHPVGASHHQKIVVIDDRVAFSGGLDLSVWRWDTPAHRPEDPRRVDPSGRAYPPFHDVQMVVDGPAAKALAELARARWKRATGRRLHPPRGRHDSEPWPDHVAVELNHVPVAIARTVSAFGEDAPVTEVEQLYHDSIESARKFIYLENQYFSSRRLAEALARRLAEPDGPELVMVLPLHTGGWLEQNTMDRLRTLLVEHLRAADQHGHLGVFYPLIQNGDQHPIYVHSKIQIVDDQFVRVGSSNLSNRSMRLDTECDLAIASEGSDPIRQAIARFRTRLLAEHLGLNREEAAESLLAPPSLIQAIEQHQGNSATLKPLPKGLISDWDRQLAESQWLDPEQPMDADLVIGDIIPAERRRSVQQRILRTAGLVGLVILAGVLLRRNPPGESLDLGTLEQAVQMLNEQPMGPALVMAAVALAATVGIPITVVVVLVALTFGPWLALLYGYTGAQLSAFLTFTLAHRARRAPARWLTGRRWSGLIRQLSERGVLAVILVRLLPVAPFVIVNLAAGASRLSWRDYAIGSLLGMVPGVLAVVLLTDRVEAVLEQPGLMRLILLTLATLVALSGIAIIHRWIRRTMKRR